MPIFRFIFSPADAHRHGQGHWHRYGHTHGHRQGTIVEFGYHF